jgi:hypothetical protein
LDLPLSWAPAIGWNTVRVLHGFLGINDRAIGAMFRTERSTRSLT